jgi:hypothetical protein
MQGCCGQSEHLKKINFNFLPFSFCSGTKGKRAKVLIRYSGIVKLFFGLIQGAIMLDQKFADFMFKYGIIYAVIADLDKNTVISSGWRYKLPYDGLLKSLFEDEDTVRSVNDSLDGQILPQSMIQGDLNCSLCKPKENILVGLFYIDKRDSIESYEFSNQLNNELNIMFNDAG